MVSEDELLPPLFDDGATVEDGLLAVNEAEEPPPPPTPSKKLIKEAILRGEPVANARIVKHDRLTIK